MIKILNFFKENFNFEVSDIKSFLIYMKDDAYNKNINVTTESILALLKEVDNKLLENLSISELNDFQDLKEVYLTILK